MVANSPTPNLNPAPALVNPLVTPLGMAESIALVNNLDFTLVGELELKRRAVVSGFLQNHEALAKMANSWEAAAKMLGGTN